MRDERTLLSRCSYGSQLSALDNRLKVVGLHRGIKLRTIVFLRSQVVNPATSMGQAVYLDAALPRCPVPLSLKQLPLQELLIAGGCVMGKQS